MWWDSAFKVKHCYLVGEGATVAETLLLVYGQGVGLDPEVMLQPRLVPQQVLHTHIQATPKIWLLWDHQRDVVTVFFGLAVFCLLEARILEFDTQPLPPSIAADCTVYTVHCVKFWVSSFELEEYIKLKIQWHLFADLRIPRLCSTHSSFCTLCPSVQGAQKYKFYTCVNLKFLQTLHIKLHLLTRDWPKPSICPSLFFVCDDVTRWGLPPVQAAKWIYRDLRKTGNMPSP